MINDQMTRSKLLYEQFCDENNTPIFSKYWWLDAVCGERNWDAILIEKDNRVIASLPFYIIRSKLGFKSITMPLLTQSMGPYLAEKKHKDENNRLEYEKEVLTKLINRLPDCSFFIQKFHYSVHNWLPFYWQGFSQTTHYTYVIDNISDSESVYSNFSYAKQKNIKKAEGLVTVKFDLPAKDFYENHRHTLNKQKKKIFYSYELFERLYNACYKHNAGRTIYAHDADGNIHSALFVVWDNRSAYMLISTIDNDFRNSGSSSLLIKSVIEYVSDKTERFDLEGSMIEGVERSFRQFGSTQKPYFVISKTFSRSFRLLKTIQQAFKGH